MTPADIEKSRYQSKHLTHAPLPFFQLLPSQIKFLFPVILSSLLFDGDVEEHDLSLIFVLEKFVNRFNDF